MHPLDPLIAHQGGWDEILLFGVPVLIALGAVRLMERRHPKTRGDDKRDHEENEESAGHGLRGNGTG